ncbi:2-oxoacid:acceptor oxidoreductase family protein [Ignisphaera sp. 4213-co]|uniref:pyruvate synthase n=1 Tax=Ignisphaera cupida TaxID=3050454 RepID=A0ABD4Z996_9CREN|nr:2-oxoacid:acceptor oxidoreductase family protein [Ignisphaera sp. 4213-co]MDK6029475.1 2-oxoacid:acceptor oxidoreductase family protein [Ignisphaera sp. 4213-co]
MNLKRVEIRWHGRGGQGAVTASMILAEAAIYQGKYAQAYPEFGAERRGAPVTAYTRVSTEPILTRAPIIEPDVVVVLDPSLNKSIYMEGLKRNGILVINTKKSIGDILKDIERSDVKIARVDATKIALEVLKAPFVNMAMLGALVKAIPIVDIAYIEEAIKENFRPKIAEANIQAMRRAYNEVELS